jgi:hypothetical protein
MKKTYIVLAIVVYAIIAVSVGAYIYWSYQSGITFVLSGSEGQIGVPAPASLFIENLGYSQVNIEPYNSTYISFNCTVSYDTTINAPSVQGTITFRAYDQSGKFVGEGTHPVYIEPDTSYMDPFGMVIETPSNINYLLTHDADLKYYVKIDFVSRTGYSLGINSNIVIRWKAPIDNLKLSLISSTPINSSYSLFAYNVSFINNCDFTNIEGNMTVQMQGSQGLTIGIGNVTFLDRSNYLFVNNFEVVGNASQPPTKAMISITTDFGSTNQTILIN